MGKIMVTTRAEHNYEPDRCRLSLSVETKEKTAQKASASCREQCEQLLSKLSEIGFSPENIELTDDKIDERTDYKTDAVSYVSKRTLRLDTAADVRIANAVRDLIEEVADEVGLSTSYYLSNEDELRKELLKEAIAASRAKAELLAASENAKILGIYTANLDGTEKILDITDEDDDEDDEDGDGDGFLSIMSISSEKPDNLSDKLKPGSTHLKAEIKIVWLISE